MKNLKRALSLALSSIMLMGMMVVGTGAASYDDVTAEHNVEAIEVVKAAGIMEGDDKGDFNPDAKVTRNQMAVIMCNILDYNVAQYKGTAPFNDVPEWAEPYVAACYTHGIITGYDAKTFGGEDQVSSAQASLMLMNALGYFQYQADFGDDWQLATVRYGSKAGLYDGIDSAVNSALTRNEVAQMVLNALEATMVDWTGTLGSTITTTDGTEINIGYHADYQARPFKAGVNYDNSNTNPVNNEKGSTLQLIESLYGTDFTMAGTTDKFGRPATEWKQGIVTIGKYADKATAEYVGSVKKNTLYEVLGSTLYSQLIKGDAKLTVWVDGKDTTVITDDDGAAYALNPAGVTAINEPLVHNYAQKKNSDGIAQTGNSVVTEVYVYTDSYNDVYVDLVVINTYVVQAASDYNTTRKNVVLKDQAIDNAVIGTLSATKLSADDWANLDVIKADDYLLITKAWNGSKYDIDSVTVAEVVQGTIDTYAQNWNNDDAGQNVTLDGVKYGYSKNIGTTDKKTNYVVGQTAALVLDTYGNVIAVAEAVLSSDWLYVEDTEMDTLLNRGNVVARVYDMNGVSEVVKVEKLVDNAGNNVVVNSLNVDTFEAKWYRYTKDSKGNVTLYAEDDETVVATDTDTIGVYSFNKVFPTASPYTVAIDTGVVSFMKNFGGNAANLYGNAKTTLVLIDTDEEIYTYTGINNFPQISACANENLTVKVVYDGNPASAAQVKVVFIDLSGADKAKVVIDEVANTAEYVYVLDKVSEIIGADNKTTYVMNVVEAGSDEVVKKTFKTGSVVNQWTLYKSTRETDGVITKGAAVTSSASRVVTSISGQSVTLTGNVLSFGANNYEVSNCTITVISKVSDLNNDKGATYEVDMMSASQLASLLKGKSVSANIWGERLDDNLDVMKSLYVEITAAV